jgi:hypothetical protein
VNLGIKYHLFIPIPTVSLSPMSLHHPPPKSNPCLTGPIFLSHLCPLPSPSSYICPNPHSPLQLPMASLSPHKPSFQKTIGLLLGLAAWNQVDFPVPSW